MEPDTIRDSNMPAYYTLYISAYYKLYISAYFKLYISEYFTSYFCASSTYRSKFGMYPLCMESFLL